MYVTVVRNEPGEPVDVLLVYFKTEYPAHRYACSIVQDERPVKETAMARRAFAMSDEMTQRLMNNLWHIGFRPEEPYAKGEVPTQRLIDGRMESELPDKEENPTPDFQAQAEDIPEFQKRIYRDINNQLERIETAAAKAQKSRGTHKAAIEQLQERFDGLKEKVVALETLAEKRPTAEPPKEFGQECLDDLKEITKRLRTLEKKAENPPQLTGLAERLFEINKEGHRIFGRRLKALEKKSETLSEAPDIVLAQRALADIGKALTDIHSVLEQIRDGHKFT